MNELNILMLESDEHDRQISAGFFSGRNLSYELLRYSNELMENLNSRLQAKQNLPEVVILSLHAVPDTGYSVLSQIKAKPAFRHIPVVILGEHCTAAMVKKCYAAGASTVINKPFNSEEARFKINSFLDYWFEVAEPAVDMAY